MARQKSVTLAGKLGNLIFYEWNKIPCVRTRPEKVKQTKATKRSAGTFGKAKQISRVLRAELHSILTDTKNRQLMYCLDSALRQWLSSGKLNDKTALAFIDQLQFNKETELKERFKASLSVNWNDPGKIYINIPELQAVKFIQAPARTQEVQILFTVCDCSLSSYMSSGNFTKTIKLPYNNNNIAAQQVVLPFHIKPGSLTIVVAALKYTRENNGMPETVTDKRWLPAAIIGAKHSGA